MAKKKTNQTAGGENPSAVMVYLPTKEATKNPRRYQLDNKEWIGVGGEITIKAKPPTFPKDRIFREATPEEYKLLFNRGLKHLVYVSTTESNS